MELGERIGFTRRRRQVTAERLVVSVISALASQKARSLADILRAFNALTGCTVQYKPFHNQLAKDEFAELMRVAFSDMLQHLLLTVLEPLRGSVLKRVSDVVIQDGTSFALHRELAQAYPGRFRAVSPAAVELHATMSVRHDQVTRVTLAPDKEAERDFLPEPNELSGRLLLADRGYADVGYCSRLQEADAYFIIRFKGDVKPTVRQAFTHGRRRRSVEGDGLSWALSKLGRKDVDLDVEWKRGDGVHIRLRLIALWNPKTKERVFLATNLPREAVSVETVATLYRLRWQIELVFKEWKSFANLHAFCTRKVPIAEGLMWGALAAALLKRFLAHATEQACAKVTLSTQRTAAALCHHLPQLMQALLRGRGATNRLRSMLTYLAINARRAHPARDKRCGRLRGGLLRHRALAAEVGLKN
jgi:hypothetical protein